MGGQMRSDLNNLCRIRHGFCRIPIGRNPIRISSEFDGIRWNQSRISSRAVEFRRNPDRIPTDRNPTKTISDPIGFLWKLSVSDEIRLGFDWKRSDLLVGLDLLGIAVPLGRTLSLLFVSMLSYFASNLLLSRDMTWEFYFSKICIPYCNKTLVPYLYSAINLMLSMIA
jgi:hypothetical protein